MEEEQEMLENVEHALKNFNGRAIDCIAIGEMLIKYKELKEEVESQDKTIDKLVEEQEEREKYTHSLEEENTLLKHRLKTANEFIESRQEVLIPENYEDLKYILNECDLESTW